MNLKQLMDMEVNPEKKSNVQIKALKALAAFLVIMVLLTLLSRAADSLTIAKVTVTGASSQSIAHNIEADGTVEANRDLAVSTTGGIKLASVEAVEGTTVKAGDLLFLLDTDDLKKQLLKAQKELDVLNATASDKRANDAIAASEKQKNIDRAYEDYDETIDQASEAVSEAKEEMNKAYKAYEDYLASMGQTPETDPTVADSLQKTIDEKSQLYDEALSHLADVQKQVDYDSGKEIDEAIKAASVDEEGNPKELTDSEKQAIISEIMKKYQPLIDEAQKLADEAKAEADVPAADSVPAKGLAEPVAQPPLVSIIIASRDRSDSLDRCLRSIREHTAYKNYEVIIVENGSEDPRTFEYYRSAEAVDPRVKTIFYQQDGTFDEARLVNFGASRASGDYILLMHNDVEVTDGEWMSRLVSLCARKGTGAAAARLVRVDGTIESSGMHLTSSGPVADGRYLLSRANERPQTALLHSVTMASGACLMVDAAAFFQLGGMQLRYPARLGDADLCLRLWGLGLRVVIDPKVELLHHRSLVAEDCGSGTTSDIRAIGRLWESWPFGQSPCDPTMGPNLDQQSAYRALLA